MKFSLNNPQQVREYCALNKRRVEYFMKMAAVEVYRRLIMVSPVDTGNFRWNWWCSVGDLTYKYNEVEHAAPDNGRALSVFVDFDTNDSLYICNSTPYAKRLNQGWSKQAPARFMEQTVAGVQKDVNIFIKRTQEEVR